MNLTIICVIIYILLTAFVHAIAEEFTDWDEGGLVLITVFWPVFVIFMPPVYLFLKVSDVFKFIIRQIRKLSK